MDLVMKCHLKLHIDITLHHEACFLDTVWFIHYK